MSATTPPQERLFLVSQSDIDKIDSLVGALNLAITEILEGRPVRDPCPERGAAQADYDEQVGEVIFRGNLLDHWTDD